MEIKEEKLDGRNLPSAPVGADQKWCNVSDQQAKLLQSRKQSSQTHTPCASALQKRSQKLHQNIRCVSICLLGSDLHVQMSLLYLAVLKMGTCMSECKGARHASACEIGHLGLAICMCFQVPGM